MIEWLVLILLVPLILVPLVLLFGFAGCDVILGLERREFSKAFEAVLNDDTGRRSRTVVQRIEPVRLSGSGTALRITLEKPSTDNLVILKITVSHAADPADPGNYNSASAPVEVPESYPILVPADPANGPFVLKAVAFPYDRLRPLLVAFDVDQEGACRRGPAASTDARVFIGPLLDPPIYEATIDVRQPGYAPENRIYFVKQIDVS